MMKERIQFKNMVTERLSHIDADALAFNKDEFWTIQREYEYIEYYSIEKRLMNTALALHLAVGLHNGSYRKSTITKNNQTYKLPYVIHCLWVCRMLADLSVPVTHYEEDILLASALCHDMIEDVDFPDGGRELYAKYGLDPQIYKIVKLLSKRYDFTDEQEHAFFHNIESNKLALLVKLSDRCHNVEDLYNRPSWKVHEYVGETRKFFIPMCEYGLEHYEDIYTTLQILHEKLINLTQAAEVLVDRYDQRKEALLKELDRLKEEQKHLRQEWEALWKDPQ